jgi:acyl carrier protein
MDSITFLAKVAEVLDYEGALEAGQALEDVEVWDSLGILSVVDLLEELGAEVNIDALADVVTTDDLIKLAGSAIDG